MSSIQAQDERFSSGPFICEIVRKEEIAPRHFRMTLWQPAIAMAARPGQFVHILCRNSGNSDPLLRRAFSVMSTDGESFDVLFRVDGRGTAWLSQSCEGESLDILGPLGNGFDLANRGSKVAVLVGGGVGVPPLVFAAKALQAQGEQRILAFIGARSRTDLIGIEDLRQAGVTVHLTTEDGSVGTAGRVTGPLQKYLDSADETPEQRVVYACGPYPMLKAVGLLCLSRGVPCQVSMEENMPCGIGLCNGCVVPTLVRENGTDYERYARICVSGPALWAVSVDWGQD